MNLDLCIEFLPHVHSPLLRRHNPLACKSKTRATTNHSRLFMFVLYEEKAGVHGAFYQVLKGTPKHMENMESGV